MQIGDVGHYNTMVVEDESMCRHAVVTRIHPDGNMNLTVFEEDGSVRPVRWVPRSDPTTRGTFHTKGQCPYNR